MDATHIIKPDGIHYVHIDSIDRDTYVFGHGHGDGDPVPIYSGAGGADDDEAIALWNKAFCKAPILYLDEVES